MAGSSYTYVKHFADWEKKATDTHADRIRATHTPVDALKALPIYNILNGETADVVPYLTRPTVPEYARWVPIPGMRHKKALECVDAFIKSHIWHIKTHCPDKWTPDMVRKAGVILGVCRAVIYANYEISTDRLIEGETTSAYLTVDFSNDETAAPTYTCIVPDTRTAAQKAPEGADAIPDPRADLIGAFEFSPEENEVLSVLVQTAQCVIPLQGYGLITEGHHYLSDKSRASYRACLGVERQLWVGDRPTAWFGDTTLGVRDLIWHKSGHPVAIGVKQLAATSERVAENLRAAELDAAVTRLPAVESEVRSIQAFLRVTDNVRSAFETHDGELDNTLLREVDRALKHFPVEVNASNYTAPAVAPVMLGQTLDDNGNLVGGTRVSTRREVIAFAKDLITRCQALVATCYGYYTAMLEAHSSMGAAGGGRGDTLSRAYSLKRLTNENIAAFNEGVEYYRDHQAARAKARREGTVKAPRIYIT